MLVFATSDKGGTGRTVTSSNIAYRRALRGDDVCYADFDFGSPTAGAVFHVPGVARGTKDDGLHSCLRGRVERPRGVDVWMESDDPNMRVPPPGAGRLVLFPGDSGGGEFSIDDDMVRRCVTLFLALEEEFDVSVIDVSAGRSYAIEAALAATADHRLAPVTCRWLVFHRWTQQHIKAAADLVFGDWGIVETGVARGHHRDRLTGSIRFVRTAVVDPNAEDLAGLRATQVAWLRSCNDRLQREAGKLRIGRTAILGVVPFDPMLQWREQLVSDDDVLVTQIANQATVTAFDTLAGRLTEESAWERL